MKKFALVLVFIICGSMEVLPGNDTGLTLSKDKSLDLFEVYYSVKKEGRDILITITQPVKVRHHTTKNHAPYGESTFYKGTVIRVQPDQWLSMYVRVGSSFNYAWAYCEDADNR